MMLINGPNRWLGVWMILRRPGPKDLNARVFAEVKQDQDCSLNLLKGLRFISGDGVPVQIEPEV